MLSQSPVPITPFRCFTYELYTGQRFQTIQFLRAREHVHVSFGVFSFQLSAISISLLSRKLWRRLEYIYISLFRAPRVPQEWKRTGDPENSERLTCTLAIPSLKFLGDFRTFLAWSGHQLGHAQSSTVFARLHFPFEAHSLQISGWRLRECNRNSSWNIGIDPSARGKRIIPSLLRVVELIFFLLREILIRVWNRSEHVSEAKWDNWINLCMMCRCGCWKFGLRRK